MNKKFSIPVKDIDVVNLGDNFLKLKIYAISDGVNRKKSEFLLESFEPSIPSIYNKPILAYYNPEINDTEEHNSIISVDKNGEIFENFQYSKGEKPVGVIPESADIRIENRKGKNWIVIDGGIIWSNYSKQLTDLICKYKEKKISVEVEFLKSKFVDGIEQVELFNFLGVTIIGEDYIEGIADAHLEIKDISETEDFKKYRNALVFALMKDKKINILSKYGIEEKEMMGKENFISKDEYGSGSELKVDKTKTSVSNQSWGDIDKTQLRNDVLKAKNYKSIVRDVYLDVEEGWEDAPSQKLKYPVMQIKGNKLVYNANGLLSAQQYGEHYDSTVAKKALNIRKKLGLTLSDKEARMKKFIDSAKEQGMSFIGFFDDKLRFIEECEYKDDVDVEREEMSNGEYDKDLILYEIDKIKCGDCFIKEDCKPVKMKVFDDCEYDDDDDEDEVDIEVDPDKKEDKATYAVRLKNAEDKAEQAEIEKKKMAKELKMVKDELKQMHEKEFIQKMDEVFADECDEDMKDELKEMAKQGKFSDFEDFKKEYAYRKYKKEEEEKENSKKFVFSVYSGRVNTFSKDPLDFI